MVIGSLLIFLAAGALLLLGSSLVFSNRRMSLNGGVFGGQRGWLLMEDLFTYIWQWWRRWK
ncbi:MAG: hypothetical protein ACLGQX_13895, partial [Acidobacteriota bacterium]